MTILRKLYDWVLKQADTPHAQTALFIVAFAESSFFPLPPDILLIAMVIANREKWLRYFLICLAGSVLGGIAGYYIGFGIWQAVQEWFFVHVFSPETFQKVTDLYARYDFWAVFTAGFTPIPYKIFTIAAGVAKLDLLRFIAASIFGRGGRFILVSFLLYHFGPSIKSFIDKYFGWLTMLFTVLLIGGFWLLKHLH
ncbi:MAG: DedA family protein [Candidatus Omnitrophica bacterium]|nr:DedA family protein [Candidatus Omnitrophota bacterium]